MLVEICRAIEANKGRIDQRLSTIFAEDVLKGPNGTLIEEARGLNRSAS